MTSGPVMFILDNWKTRNMIVVKDEIFFVQRGKTSFVFLLWLETKVTIKDDPSTIVCLLIE